MKTNILTLNSQRETQHDLIQHTQITLQVGLRQALITQLHNWSQVLA